MRRLLDIASDVLILVALALLLPFGMLVIGLPLAGVLRLAGAAIARLLGTGG